MDKRKQDPIIGERALFTLKSATEFSPKVDKSCPVLYKVIITAGATQITTVCL